MMEINLQSSKNIFFCSGLVTLCMFIFGFIFSVLFQSVSTNTSEATLEFVIAVCRHGSRSPIFFYPNDPFNNSLYWPDGMGGAMTNKGKMQMFQLGKNFRNRYNHIFQGTYKPEDIYVRSTQVGRTYMSVALLLAGMFPPSGNSVWNSELLWQPIPIWPDSFDKTEIVTNHSICTKFTEEQQGVIYESQWYLEENKDLFDYIIKHSGHSIKRIDDYITVWDAISCEDMVGLSLPAWTRSVYPDKLEAAASYMFKTVVSGTKEMNRLISGPLLKDFNSWINRKISGGVTEKMLLHSGHDFTLIGLLSAVGFNEIKVIKPSASLMIEIYLSPEGRTVKMFYANDSTIESPMLLNMPKCQVPCALENFIRVLKELETKDDWEAECNL